MMLDGEKLANNGRSRPTSKLGAVVGTGYSGGNILYFVE